LGGARGNRIRDGVALYSPALKIYTAARLCRLSLTMLNFEVHSIISIAAATLGYCRTRLTGLVERRSGEERFRLFLGFFAEQRQFGRLRRLAQKIL
jgi:hypothetical protein